MKKRRPYWILFFILFVVALAALWTTSNVYFYQKYTGLMEQLRDFRGLEKMADFREPIIWMTTFLGIGFGVGMLGLGVFFIRLLREMRLSQMQKDFLARVSHELQSPVSSLELSSSMLRSQKAEISPEEQRSLWDIHDSELKRLRVEIESLLEASRWEHHGFRPQIQALNFEEWLENAFVGWEKIIGPAGRIQRSGAAFDFRASLDPRLMLFITNNLVDNARKYAKAGSLILDVKTSVKVRPEGGHYWKLEFVDNGMGFGPELAKTIFRKFEKGPARLKSGYGIGLFLVREACREQDVEIVAHSDGAGRGATFTLLGGSEIHL